MNTRIASALFLFLLAATTLSVRAQVPLHYYDQWQFGFYSGIDFRSGTPALSESSIHTAEGSASISDPKTGRLLFYTDGISVWNREHEKMPSGDGLKGQISSAQACVIVPVPGRSDRFIIVTAGAGPYVGPSTTGINYSIVDMQLDGGLGDVTEKNQPLLLDASERLVAIGHCDGESYWVVANKRGTPRIFAWEVGPGGLDPTPIISVAGTADVDDGSSSIGQFKASPDGKFICKTFWLEKKAELLAFDNSTGQATSLVATLKGSYGASFSPNSRFLYTSNGSELYQYDVESPNVSATERQVFSTSPSNAPDQFGSMQIGPDRRVYVTNPDSEGGDVWRIEAADRPDAVLTGPHVSAAPGSNILLGLPNCIDGFLSSEDRALIDTTLVDIELGDSTVCVGEPVFLGEKIAREDDGFAWSIQGAVPDTSTDHVPGFVSYSDTGRFRIILTGTRGCYIGRDTAYVTVRSQPDVSLPDTVRLCAGDTVQLDAGEWDSYEWDPVSELSCSDCRNPFAFPPESRTYTVTVENEFGCLDSAAVYVAVADASDLVVSPDTAICPGESVSLTASGADRYEWSPDIDIDCLNCPSPMVSPKRSMTYFVRGSVGDSCFWRDSVRVTVRSEPDVDAGDDVQVCAGESVTIGSPGSQSDTVNLVVSWEPTTGVGDPGSLITDVAPRSTTTYRLTAFDSATGCTRRDSVLVTVLPLPDVGAGDDIELCPGDTGTIGSVGPLADTSNLVVTWQPATGVGDPDALITTVAPNSTTTYRLTAVNAATGCVRMDSVSVTVHSVPEIDLGDDVAICPNNFAEVGVDSDTSLYTYRWSPQDGVEDPLSSRTRVQPNRPTVYTLRVTNRETGCTGTDSIRIDLHPLPDISAGTFREATICPGDSILLGVPLNTDLAGEVVFEWIPTGTLSNPSDPRPIAFPDGRTAYIVTARSIATGCVVRDTVVVDVRDPVRYQSSIPRDYSAASHEPIEIAIRIDDVDGGTGISSVEILLEYDRDIMLVDSSSLHDLLDGTLLSGWRLTILERRPGAILLRLDAPAGATLEGSGDLLRFESRLYLGATSFTEIDYTVDVIDGCATIEESPGFARVDTVCGLSMRLIEPIFGKDVALKAIPNPSDHDVRIQFGVALDGYARIEVFDGNGRRLAALVDSFLEQGVYETTWDARRFGSGVYWLRLRHGDRTDLLRLMVQ